LHRAIGPSGDEIRGSLENSGSVRELGREIGDGPGIDLALVPLLEDGEIGQTQFMPSSYIKFAVDFDGNGRRDLLHSAPDVLASTANFLSSHGWQRNKAWEPGSTNFDVIQQWNKSEVYAKTIASFASQLDKMP
jgi:membrane-bound lytic murein transglycosylase B